MLGGLLGKITKRGLLAIVAVPEGMVMLTIAILLDFIGLILFIFSLFGVGIPLSFLLDAAGAITIGAWAMMRPFFRSAIGSMVDRTIGQDSGSQSPLGQIAGAAGGMAGRAVKRGLGTGLSILRFIITLVIELVPFLGDIFPGWTFYVIFTLIEGEIFT